MQKRRSEEELERDWLTLTPEERVDQRQERSKPIVDRIEARLKEQRAAIPPQSKLGGALTSLANQWDTLVVFLADGRAALSNNRMENLIRPFAVGRKNWQGMARSGPFLLDTNVSLV